MLRGHSYETISAVFNISLFVFSIALLFQDEHCNKTGGFRKYSRLAIFSSLCKHRGPIAIKPAFRRQIKHKILLVWLKQSCLMFSWVFSVQMQNKNNHHCIFFFPQKELTFQSGDTMKKIHLNAVKIFLFLVTATLGEGLSSSGEIKVNVLVIIKRGKGGRQIISVYLVSSQSESRAFRLISFVLTVRHFYCAQCQYLSLYFRNCSYHLPCTPPACELVSIVCEPISFYQVALLPRLFC